MPTFALDLHLDSNEGPRHTSIELDKEPVAGQVVAIEGQIWRVWGVRPTRDGASWSDVFVCALEKPYPRQ
jgi:hypothetical protein